MSPYGTLSGTMNELDKQGYTEDFNLWQNCFECRNGEFRLMDNEFKVDRFFRFEGESNPSDSAILYAISSDAKNLKGLLVNAYRIYSEPFADKMVKKLTMRHPQRKHVHAKRIFSNAFYQTVRTFKIWFVLK